MAPASIYFIPNRNCAIRIFLIKEQECIAATLDNRNALEVQESVQSENPGISIVSGLSMIGYQNNLDVFAMWQLIDAVH